MCLKMLEYHWQVEKAAVISRVACKTVIVFDFRAIENDSTSVVCCDVTVTGEMASILQ